MSKWLGLFREYLRAATKIRPHVVLDIIKAGEGFEVKDGIKVGQKITKID